MYIIMNVYYNIMNAYYNIMNVYYYQRFLLSGIQPSFWDAQVSSKAMAP